MSARLCTQLQNAARQEHGVDAKLVSEDANAARNAYRMIKRLGIAWKVPLDIYKFTSEDGSTLDIHYLHPKKLMEYLVQKHPIVVFGTNKADKAEQSLLAFWEGFKLYHPTHEVFTSGLPLKQTIPALVHGDEGRGKRRSNTTVVSWESAIGIKGHSSMFTTCKPACLWDTSLGGEMQHPFIHLLRSNMKSHSFLQHWPMFLLPGLWKECKSLTFELLEFFAEHFRLLFHNGFEVKGRVFHIAIIASKGDLKWVSKIGKLSRGYENKSTKKDVCSCHQCFAGLPGLPAEDIDTSPSWEKTIHVERPWEAWDEPPLLRIPYDSARPEWLYKQDAFHILRLGVFRDFTASTIFLWMKWGYFQTRGGIPCELQAAHGHFCLWLRSTKQSAALRSFSKALFNYKSKKSYVWSNTKGSDSTLLCKWISTASVGFMFEEADPEKREVLSVILSTSRLATDWFDLIYSHGAFLTHSCGARLYEMGQAFLSGYKWLASYAFNQSLCLFGLKPKLHFQKHLLLDIFQQVKRGDTCIVSPVLFDCSQNEDFIGRVCRLTRRVDSRVLTERTLEFYLIKVAILLRRYQKEHVDLDDKSKKSSCQKGAGGKPLLDGSYLSPFGRDWGIENYCQERFFKGASDS